MSPLLFNFNFLNNKKIYQKQKKVVPAITDICTGGLLGSGVNISYYLHWGEFLVIVLKKYEGMQISLSNLAHTYILVL